MSGKIIDDPYPHARCTHPTHTPPMHLVVPAGKVYVNTCEGCGKVSVMRSSQVIC